MKSIHPHHQTLSSDRFIGSSARILIRGLLALSALAAGVTLFRGGFTLPLGVLEVGELRDSIGIRVDSVSAILALMVTVVGATVSRYSDRYLSGEAGQARFQGMLFLILASVLLLISANHFLTLLVAWVSASVSLHQLLVFYPERRGAVLAARKKFIISRLGDLCLLAGMVLVYDTFHTLEFERVFSGAEELVTRFGDSGRISWIGSLFVLGALTKSAQFPFHFWLPETMETPTPVSALMHAGVINAGGIFVILLSPLLQHAEFAHLLLAWVGACTAVFGSLVMITQNDIKKKLAYSTISQMGLMMFTCGLGAYSIALFHIVAHSFYKSHAFLSTGTIIEESRMSVSKPICSSPLFFVMSSGIGFSMLYVGSRVADGAFIAYFAYGAVLWLGLAQTWFSGEFLKFDLRFLVRMISILVLAAGMCGGLEFWIHHGMRDLVPQQWGEHGNKLITCVGTFFMFSAGFWISAMLSSRQGGARARGLYLYFWNGGYFQQITSRWMKTLGIA